MDGDKILHVTLTSRMLGADGSEYLLFYLTQCVVVFCLYEENDQKRGEEKKVDG